MKTIIVTCLLGLSIVASAETITTLDGRLYHNVKITKTDPAGINIIHASGACYIPFTNLPQIIRDAHRYDSEASSTFIAQQREAERARVKGEEGRRKEEASRSVVHIPQTTRPTTSTTLEETARPTETSSGMPTRDYSSRDYSSRSYSAGRIHVRAYYRKDGTYVRAHTRRR